MYVWSLALPTDRIFPALRKIILYLVLSRLTFLIIMSDKDEIQRALAVFPPSSARTAVILGSGLGRFADRLNGATKLEAGSVPHWPVPAVEGHAGEIVFGSLSGAPLIVLEGRVHFYEGHSMRSLAFPIRVLAAAGIKNLILTNAAGGINPDLRAGDIMLVTDHLNLMFTNPLIGPPFGTGERFPDMSQCYHPVLQQKAREAAAARGIELKEGVLAVTTGPCYETSAEVKMIRILGGDAVCMSTVPEVVTAVQLDLRTAALSCITNAATGISPGPLNHAEVKKTAGEMERRLGGLLEELIIKIDSES